MPLRLRVIPASSRKRKTGSGRATPSDDAERSIDFDDRVGQIRIGRRADLELSLPFSPLSGVHARLVRASDEKSGSWLLEDLGSTNGTFVERAPVEGEVALRDGDRIQVGTVDLTVHLSPAGQLPDTKKIRRRIT
jgi:pSer/pThr/pTyr-binding forkhead associated (FHA) protein